MKSCINCGSKITQKYGLQNGKQRHKCYVCKKVFIDNRRKTDQELWTLYAEGKQTYSQLASQEGCSIRTIQRIIDRVKLNKSQVQARSVIVLTDTTYWGRNFGVMLFKDAITGENLYKKYVKHETIMLYREGFEVLLKSGFIIKAIVCDGKKGLLQMYPSLPTQMCQFHQKLIIRRYLTKKPKMQASIELWEHSKMLTKTDKESFIGGLNQWYDKWKDFINERSSATIQNKSTYKHKRLRSAYNSLKRNLPYLFVWYDHYELNIPNTTNAIDGHFSDLKNKLRCHNGLTEERKRKFIDGFLKV